MHVNDKVTVKVSMTGYIDEAVYKLPKNVTTPIISPAADHILKINRNGKRLNEERAILFHWLSAELLFVRNISRPDIHPTIEFLMKIV